MCINVILPACQGFSEVKKGDDVFRPFIIDVEASGFGSSSYPIEIGVALEYGSRHSALIKPADDWIHKFPEYTRSNFRAETAMDPYAAEYDRERMLTGWFDKPLVQPSCSLNASFRAYCIGKSVMEGRLDE